MANPASDRYGMHPNSEMTAIGYLMAAVLVVLLLPLLPFFLVYLAIDWLTAEASGASADEGWGDERPDSSERPLVHEGAQTAGSSERPEGGEEPPAGDQPQPGD